MVVVADNYDGIPFFSVVLTFRLLQSEPFFCTLT
jgi:hypothetical protein